MYYYIMKCLFSMEKKAVRGWRIWFYVLRICLRNLEWLWEFGEGNDFFKKLNEECEMGVLVLKRRYRRKEIGFRNWMEAWVIFKWWRRIRLVKRYGYCELGGRIVWVKFVRCERVGVWGGVFYMVEVNVGGMGCRRWGFG